MDKNWLARRATRWWSQPVRFTANAVAALRRASSTTGKRSGAWLAHAPVGSRALTPQS